MLGTLEGLFRCYAIITLIGQAAQALSVRSFVDGVRRNSAHRLETKFDIDIVYYRQFTSSARSCDSRFCLFSLTGDGLISHVQIHVI